MMYDLEISEDPEILLYGPFGLEFLRYRCLRIFYTGENIRPNFRQCDFSFSFDYSENPRNYRFPDYAAYADVRQLTQPKDFDTIVHAKTRFCSFVVSNPIPQPRIKFFKMLSRYKRVDSFGRVLNNMPVAEEPEDGRSTDWQGSKLGLTANYKFAITFESASYPGYVTEKILHAMLSNSIPIYWGNPRVHEDFNSRSFINCHEHRDFDDVVQRVIAIDNNEKLYREILAEPWFVNNRIPDNVAEENVMRRLKFIVDQRHSIVPVARLNRTNSPHSRVEDLRWALGPWDKVMIKLKREIYAWKYGFYARRYMK